MKTKRWKVVAVLVVALPFGLTSSALARPSSQCWAQQHAEAPGAADGNAQATMPCAKCKDSPVMKPVYGYFPGGEIDDYRIQWIAVGTKHACATCGGSITLIQVKTTNSMQLNCSICAKAEPNCCKI